MMGSYVAECMQVVSAPMIDAVGSASTTILLLGLARPGGGNEELCNDYSCSHHHVFQL